MIMARIRRGMAPETDQRLVKEGGQGVAQDCLEHDAHAEEQHGEDDDEVLPGRQGVLQDDVVVQSGQA